MARDPNDVALERQMPDYFAQKAKEMGAPDVAGLTDAEHHALANEAFRSNLNAKALNGPLPKYLKRLADAGLDDQTLADMAEKWQDGETKESAYARFQRDVARMSGFDVPEPKENKLFGDPFAGF